MADYYTSFSVLLPVPNIDDAEQKMKDWVVEKNSEEPGEDEGSVQIQWDRFQHQVWLYEESEGDVERAACLIADYLIHFNIEGGVFMSWAGTCSKPRVNESVGGGVVVTKDRSIWVHSFCAVKEAEEAGIQVIN
jgi:hypothetical protein